MGVVCNVSGHKWNGCTCKRCGEKRDEGHDYVPVPGDCREKCSICGDVRELEHEWHGCTCARCGQMREGEHDWGAPEPMAGNRSAHKQTCSRCDRQQWTHHVFEALPGCRRRCTECGYEEAHHEFVDGACTACGADESEFYCSLILSGEVSFFENEEKGEHGYVKFGDHVRSIDALVKIAEACDSGAIDDPRVREECEKRLASQISRE